MTMKDSPTMQRDDYKAGYAAGVAVCVAYHLNAAKICRDIAAVNTGGYAADLITHAIDHEVEAQEIAAIALAEGKI